MSLSDTTIKAAKPKPDKPYKLSDEKGLYLLINPNGAKYFRLKYRFAGKEKILAWGVYPETTLKQAREKRETARKLIADGIDPNENKKAVKSSKQLAQLVFVRPSELRQAEWEHIDLESKEWRYLVTKTQTPHIVPLSTQAVLILQSIKPLRNVHKLI